MYPIQNRHNLIIVFFHCTLIFRCPIAAFMPDIYVMVINGVVFQSPIATTITIVPIYCMAPPPNITR